jgi:hypothetical protein
MKQRHIKRGDNYYELLLVSAVVSIVAVRVWARRHWLSENRKWHPSHCSHALGRKPSGWPLTFSC